ncbi:MAG: PQQ-binding-like beta-propeller repeat protein [Gemmatimonadaceae bacterium]
MKQERRSAWSRSFAGVVSVKRMPVVDCGRNKVAAAKAHLTRARIRAILVCAALAAACAQSEPTAPSRAFPWSVALPETHGNIVVDDSAYFVATSREHGLVSIDRATRRIRWHVLMDSGGSGGWLSAHIQLVKGVIVAIDYGLNGYDARTVALKWRYFPTGEYGLGLGSATDGETVFAPTYEGDVYAVDAQTGAERWHVRVPNEPRRMFPARPLFHAGTLYIAYRSDTSLVPGGGLIALDASTGMTRWRRDLDHRVPFAWAGSLMRAAIWSDFVYVSNEDGRIFALSQSDGSVRWIVDPLPEQNAYNDSRPLAVSGDLLIAGSSTGVLVAYGAVDGKLRWKRDLQRGTIIEALVVAGDAVFASDLSSGLTAVNAATGEIMWTRGVSASGYGTFNESPLVVGDTVIVPGFHGVQAFTVR